MAVCPSGGVILSTPVAYLSQLTWAECSSLHNEQVGDTRVFSSAVLARGPLIRSAFLLSQVGSALTWAEFLQFAFSLGTATVECTPLHTVQ